MDTAAIVSRMRRIGADLAEVEVKAAGGGFPKSVAETLSAFSNGSGGVLLLGLSEHDGFAPAPGFDAKAVRDALAVVCADLMDPPLRIDIDIQEFEDALIVVAEVPELDPIDKPCFVKARGQYQGSFVRGGDGDRRLTHYEVSQLLSNRTQPAYDLEPVRGATRIDLDDELVRGLVNRARQRQPRAFAKLSDDQALVRLNVLTEDDGTLRPTLGGLIALGSYPQQFFPQLFISVVVLPGTEMGDQSVSGVRFLDNVTADGPISVMLAEASAALQRNMRRAAVIDGLFREDRYEYPLEVIRELLVNALMHRDYSPGVRGTQVQVELYRDRLVVKSPGGLYGNVVAPLLGTSMQVSSSRNAALARLLSDLPGDSTGYHAVSENRGSGLPSVMTALRRVGMSPAAFDVTPGHVHVTVPQSALLGMEVVEWIGTLGQQGLTNPQHLALAMMRSTGRVTNAMLQAWGVDRTSAGAALKDLVDRGLAVVTGGRRYASYQLTFPFDEEAFYLDSASELASVAEGSGIDADLDAIVQAIAAGHDSTKSLEAILGMNYQAVLRRLNKLIDRGAIERLYPRNDRRQRYRLIPPGE
ncbi:putative DNA binding domain-containing protein [Nocardia sp. NBC_01503]|uniref:ATP-binding protein n=1 Tax=Nocardia sp. NBC_01503 TaxID=2975997 RepID=UPI002E7B5ED6|nr:ATP-binding protein [Nocardia sp. NBC_01503]WTL33980.1 putative DNA binding domain-containing protein [Nocardia sp. NBC_01503]